MAGQLKDLPAVLILSVTVTFASVHVMVNLRTIRTRVSVFLAAGCINKGKEGRFPFYNWEDNTEACVDSSD